MPDTFTWWRGPCDGYALGGFQTITGGDQCPPKFSYLREVKRHIFCLHSHKVAGISDLSGLTGSMRTRDTLQTPWFGGGDRAT